MRDWQPIQGYVVVRFADPHSGTCILREDQLELVSRTVNIGDLVKKRTSDAMSGFVARTSLECTLLPVYPGLELKNEALWPPRRDRILRKIPGEELRYLGEYFEGDCITYHGWVGVVSSVYEDVTIRLANKSVVLVEDSDELCTPIANQGQKNNTRIDATKGFAGIVHALSVVQEQGKDSKPAEVFYPGQRVVTKKMNLRRGIWKFGAYNANMPPKGTVVHTQENSIRVTWLACNVYDRNRSNPEPPPEYLDFDVLASGDVRAYKSQRISSETDVTVGTMKCSQLISGDYVKFVDIAGAAVKYSGNSEHGTLKRIPRTETQGYDMNVYLVRETSLKLLIHWQDGSISEEDAKSVVPYLNSDEHEVWPGKVVVEKEGGPVFSQTESATGSTDFVKLNRIGIVQSADAHERTAIVRWFTGPDVQILCFPEPVLLPGSILGALSQESSEVSCFEIVASHALTKRRGDLVLIRPEASQNTQMTEGGNGLSGSMYQYFSSTLTALRDRFAFSVVPANGVVTTTDSAREMYDWLGTIVDLGLNGIITVRLGALENIRDVRVPIERISTLVIAGAEDLLFDDMADEEMEDADSEWSEFEDSEELEQRFLHESVEYEGGQRVDADGGDDVWMTDEEEDHLDALPTDSEPGNASALLEEAPSAVEKNEIASGRPQFSRYPDVPPRFAILDELPPQAHHYIDSPVTMNANLMRRIRKEHKILQGSLPEGIWVRTWADRLDLVRVLIIGADGTPYNLAPFVIDFHFPQEFPKVPPHAHFHSWTNGWGRINPNLYEDGKICLSLLGTWSGEEKHESWSETGSSMLQVIVSLLGLVLVKEPYYSEYPFRDCSLKAFLHVCNLQDDLRHLARAAGSAGDDDVNFSATFFTRLTCFMIPRLSSNPDLIMHHILIWWHQ